MQKDRTFPVVVASYETAMGVTGMPVLARYNWQCLVVDEGHR
jgi:hypothetical protein